MTASRVGTGFDAHRFSPDSERRLVLGGVVIEGHVGLDGHSDADVVTHAVIDALLGAAGLGDIGEHFPDSDPRWKGADSLALLSSAVSDVTEAGWAVSNVDCTVVLERPKVAPHRAEMRQRLEQVVGAPVSVKASRVEGMGAIGRVEGAACWAVALLSER